MKKAEYQSNDRIYHSIKIFYSHILLLKTKLVLRIINFLDKLFLCNLKMKYRETFKMAEV